MAIKPNKWDMPFEKLTREQAKKLAAEYGAPAKKTAKKTAKKKTAKKKSST